MHLQNIQEAYESIYVQKEENLIEELSPLFDLEEEFQVETLEESILYFIEEGYDIEDIEDVLEEVLIEYKITYGGEGGSGSAKVTTGSGSKMAAKNRLDDRKSRKRKEAIDNVKATVKKAVSSAKEKAKEAKFKAVDAPAAKYASKHKIGGPAPGLSARSKDPAKRRGLRSAVLKHIGGRVVDKAKRGAEKVRGGLEKAATSTKSASDNFQSSANKKGKSVIGKFARKVADKASKAASRLGEEYEEYEEYEEIDNYDLVMEYLLDEGFAETEEDACGIMFNMSEAWVDDIINEANRGDEHATKNMSDIDAKLAKRRRRNASFDAGHTYPNAPGLPWYQKTGDVAHNTQVLRKHYNKNTRGVKKK